MPVDTQCKIQYLSGLVGSERESVPRQVFRHLWPGVPAPANPTQLAKAMGVKQNTLQGWYKKMPADQQDLLAEKYGFTEAIRLTWDGDSCSRFKEVYEGHWKPLLRAATARRSEAHNPAAPLRLVIVSNPPPIVESLGSVELFADAIKLYREVTCAGLLDAKEAVERIQADLATMLEQEFNERHKRRCDFYGIAE